MSDVLGANIRALVKEVIREEVRQAVREATRRDEYLSPKHAAKIADVSPQTIRRWVEQKKLKRYGAERILRVSLKELEQYLATRQAAQNDDEMSPEELAAKEFG